LNTILSKILTPKIYRVLLYLTILGTVLLAIRVATTQTIFFTFLLWNLFLALMPLLISKSLRYNSTINNSKIFSLLFIVLWLLFIPNSPYIFTDLMHVNNDYGMRWFDFILILIFAVNGLLLGILSLLDIFHLLTHKYTTRITHAIIFGICFLGGFGIFLGRFLRFNSWDIITRPNTLFYSIFHTLFMQETWIWTLVFGSFMWLTFLVLKPILKEKTVLN
tara:strand:+ start:28980 stop:29639 length:660 start_codon:yes stop_codon:yes gene_type:complete